MKIHEYQAKELFKKYSIPIPEGGVAFNPREAGKIAAKLGAFPVVVKAQIHAGGRGKGGGVKLAGSVEEAAGDGPHLAVRMGNDNVVDLVLVCETKVGQQPADLYRPHRIDDYYIILGCGDDSCISLSHVHAENP